MGKYEILEKDVYSVFSSNEWKAENIKTFPTNFVVMNTTNDEFIMNGVPLEYWSVIERKPGSAKLHNMANSADKFKQFQFIGLNNFDFFTSEFVLQEELDIEEE